MFEEVKRFVKEKAPQSEEAFHKEILKIRSQRREQIIYLIHQLSYQAIALGAFELTNEKDFKSFLKQITAAWDQLDGIPPRDDLYVPDFKNPDPKIGFKRLLVEELEEEFVIRVLESMMDPDYWPPSEWYDVIMHLVVLFVYHTYVFERPITVDFWLGMALNKLAYISGWLYTETYRSGHERSRTKKSAHTKTRRREEKKARALSIYEEIDGDSMGPWRAAELIAKELRMSRESIYQYLLEEGKW